MRVDYILPCKKFRRQPANADNFIKRLSVNQMESDKETGSRYSDGNVPNVNWNDNDEMNVNRYNPDNRNDNLRSREKFQKRNPVKSGFL